MSQEVALNQPQVPVLATPVVDMKVSPQYIWKSGKTFFLSKKEKLVADTYIETMSFKECEKALKGIGVVRGSLTCQRWLGRGHIKEYMLERMEEKGISAGWTKERWLAVMTRHLRANSVYEQAVLEEKEAGDGVEGQIAKANARRRKEEALKDRLATGDLYGMKLIASVKGFEVPDQKDFSNLNINIVQSNGRE